MNEDIHVVPLNDLREHYTTKTCWCNPSYDEEDGIIVHNALDQREKYETGELKQQ